MRLRPVLPIGQRLRRAAGIVLVVGVVVWTLALVIAMALNGSGTHDTLVGSAERAMGVNGSCSSPTCMIHEVQATREARGTATADAIAKTVALTPRP